MTSDDQIKDEKIQYDINREVLSLKSLSLALKYQPYHQAKLINMNILQVEKYCILIKNK